MRKEITENKKTFRFENLFIFFFDNFCVGDYIKWFKIKDAFDKAKNIFKFLALKSLDEKAEFFANVYWDIFEKEFVVFDLTKGDETRVRAVDPKLRLGYIFVFEAHSHIPMEFPAPPSKNDYNICFPTAIVAPAYRSYTVVHFVPAYQVLVYRNHWDSLVGMYIDDNWMQAWMNLENPKNKGLKFKGFVRGLGMLKDMEKKREEIFRRVRVDPEELCSR